MFSFLFLNTLVSIVDRLSLSQSYKTHERWLDMKLKLDFTRMTLLGRMTAILYPAVSQLVACQNAGWRQRRVTFSIVNGGNSSHVLAPYFQCRPPDISSKDSLSVRLHVCLLQLSDQRGLAEKLTLSFVVQSAVKHIPWLHTFLPLGFVCLHDFRPVLVSQRPTGGIKLEPGFVKTADCRSADVCLRWGRWRTVTGRIWDGFAVEAATAIFSALGPPST